MKNNNKGFSLIEMLIVMAIFMVVIIISSDGFITIQRHVSMQSSLAQSNIDGVIGLEILRSDLEAAGYGLPWNVATDITYAEADANDPQQMYNLTSGPPLAVQSGNDISLNDKSLQLNGTDYLVLRGATLAHNAASQRWSYMTRQITFATISSLSPSGYLLRTNTWPNNNFTANDKVVVVSGTEDKDPSNHRSLITNGTTFFTKYNNANMINFQPQIPTMPPNPHPLSIDSAAYFIYGVDSDDGSSPSLRMPYNRADYYVRIPTGGFHKVPDRCAPNTGILFKAIVGHKTGVQTELPLLDCVADFQVVYNLNNADVSADRLGSPTSLSAEDIRNQLKSIQVYILTHEGKKDSSFIYPNATVGVGPGLGLTSGSGRTFNLYSSWQKNYRWKVYRITVTPKNLLPTQK